MNIAFNLLIVGVVVVWIALVVWTWTDARRRIADGFLIGCATVGALFPFVGSLVYLILRPPELLADVRERELDIAAAEARLASARTAACPHCDAPGEKDFLRCPSCLRKLREACSSCSKPLEQEWRICPYCEADPLRPRSETPAPRRRRAASASGQSGGTSADGSARSQSEAESAAPAKRATTKAAAKRSTRRRETTSDSDQSSSGSGEASDGRTPGGRDGSPEPEPTA